MTTDNELRVWSETIIARVKRRDTGHGAEYTKAPDVFAFGLMEPYELATAWLAEHPADDDEATTHEWLTATYRKLDGDQWLVGTLPEYRLVIEFSGGAYVAWADDGLHAIKLRACHCRWAVRAMALGLGVYLRKESTE